MIIKTMVPLSRQSACASTAEEKAKNAKLKPKRRKIKTEPKQLHEDFCFQCGDGGELVMCDRKDCSKAYHLLCLNLPQPPYGERLPPPATSSPLWAMRWAAERTSGWSKQLSVHGGTPVGGRAGVLCSLRWAAGSCGVELGAELTLTPPGPHRPLVGQGLELWSAGRSLQLERQVGGGVFGGQWTRALTGLCPSSRLSRKVGVPLAPVRRVQRCGRRLLRVLPPVLL